MAILLRTCDSTLRRTSSRLVVVSPAVITSIESRKRVRRRTRGRSAPITAVGASPEEWITDSDFEFTVSTNELVSHSVYRAEMYRARWVFLQFLAEFQDVIVDRAGGRIVLISPDLVKQFIAADDSVGILNQELERFEFLSRQHHRCAIPLDLHLFEVRGDVIEADDLSLRDTRRVAQGGANPSQQFARTERFGHVVVRTKFKKKNFVGDVAGCA